MPPSYDLIITGASGNIGRRIVPVLAGRERSILAVGRDVEALRTMFAKHADRVAVAGYDDLAHLRTCDTLIHLAARNNDRPGSLDDFVVVNVDFAEYVAREFTRMNGNRFVNIASILSLEESNNSPYAASKALGQKKLRDHLGDRFDNVYIGYFHDRGYFGERLQFLQLLGPNFGGAIFGVFKSLKPSTSAESLADYVMETAHSLPSVDILTDDQNALFFYRTVTRLMDLAVAVAIMVLFFPVLIILSIAILLDSPGPAIFRQQRVGASQTPFSLYKFRTMKVGTVAAGTHEVGESAVTRLGQFLRRTKLDELPQAINLLRGDMTLVGPRPCLFSQKELIDARAALGVYTLKPGVTGYAQIRDIDMSSPRELALSDYRYKKLQSLLLNLNIVLQTALGRGGGDRVATAESK